MASVANDGAKNGQRRHQPRLLHPLTGSNLATLSRVLTRNGAIPPNRWPQVALAFGITLLRWPFYSMEKVKVARLRKRMPTMTPPIFIVGHWRSGTTHLYNILSRSPQFGYVPPLATGMPWDLLGIVHVLQPLMERALPAHRYIDNIPVTPDSPQEDEIALANMTSLSYYHGLYFPNRFRENFNKGVFLDGCRPEEIEQWKDIFQYFMEKISIHQQNRQLLIKNPVYSARISMLRTIWPDAKFIHIYRNPYVVFESMKNFYVKLFRELALQPYDDIPIDEHVFETYTRMMTLLLTESAALPAGSFVEMRYEDLEAAPLREVERVYETLGLEGFAAARPDFESYLEGIRDYRKNTYRYPPEVIAAVEAHWMPFIERWNYRPPNSDSAAS